MKNYYRITKTFTFLFCLMICFACQKEYSDKGGGEKKNHSPLKHQDVRKKQALFPHPAALPIDDKGQLHVQSGDRCPVCAMDVSKHEKFSGGIQLTTGKTYYFCGTGCLLRTWLNPLVYLDVDKGQLQKAVVRDYFSGENVDAGLVTWIAGSDIIGPMGPAIIPVLQDKDVAVFRERHGGKTLFHLDELTNDRWFEITGKKAVPKKVR